MIKIAYNNKTYSYDTEGLNELMIDCPEAYAKMMSIKSKRTA